MSNKLVFLLLLFLGSCMTSVREENQLYMSQALVKIADKLQKEDFNDSAITFYYKALEKSQDKSEIYATLVTLLAKQERYQDIIKLYISNQDIKAPPEIQKLIIKAHLKRGDITKALAFIRHTQKSTQNDPQLLNYEALCLDAQKKHEEAQALYKKALNFLNPSHTAAFEGISKNLKHSLALHSKDREKKNTSIPEPPRFNTVS